MSARLHFRSFVILMALLLRPFPCGRPTERRSRFNGTWQTEDSKEAEAIPVAWNHKVPVPGLAHSAPPAFPPVAQCDSRMLHQNSLGQKTICNDFKFPSTTGAFLLRAVIEYCAN